MFYESTKVYIPRCFDTDRLDYRDSVFDILACAGRSWGANGTGLMKSGKVTYEPELPPEVKISSEVAGEIVELPRLQLAAPTRGDPAGRHLRQAAARQRYTMGTTSDYVLIGTTNCRSGRFLNDATLRRV
jgi:hypothetical protein